MEGIVKRIHDAGCTLAAIYTAKGEKQAQDADFGFDDGEGELSVFWRIVGPIVRLFKSKAPAVRIGGINHVVGDRKTGKMPIALATSTEYGTATIMMDTRRFIIVGQYKTADKSDKERVRF